MMKLRKVSNVSVSSTICQECETCFTKEPQTANDACDELQTNVSHPGVRNKGSARSNRDKKKKTFHKDDKVSATTVFESKPRSNLTTLLDLCVHNISILKFHVRLKRVRINRILEISHSILEISHSILEISLPEQVLLKHVVDTN